MTEARRPNPPRRETQANEAAFSNQANSNPIVNPLPVQPEQISLLAHQHIKTYMREHNKQNLDKNDLTAVLRLSQHLRVFGLLSTAGYVNQSNAQGGEVRERTVPVWELLLGQLINLEHPPARQELREIVVQMAREEPSLYMANWRKALLLSNHWNFWARAYQED